MRKLMFLLSLSMLFIGACVPERTSRYGDAANWPPGEADTYGIGD